MKTTRRWVGDDGVRRSTVVQPGLEDETMIHAGDIAKWIAAIDTDLIDNPAKRAAVRACQRDIAKLDPAAAHHRALKMLEGMGARIPENFWSAQHLQN